MAMPAKTAGEENSPYAINRALFEEAAAIKEKMKMVENRLEKMEQHRKEVTEAVFFKVKTDYGTQLDEVRAAFNEKSKDIEKELNHLYQAQREQEASLTSHQEVLEEAKFRFTLSEYNEKKYKELEGVQNKEIKKYTDLLEIIKSSIKQYENVLGYSFQEQFRVEAPKGQQSATATTSVPTPEKKAAPVPPKKAAGAPEELKSPSKKTPPPASAGSFTSEKTDRGFEEKLSEDLDVFLESEGDYFTSGAEESLFEDPVPSKTPAAKAAPAPAPAPSTAKQGLEDSLSAILKDIPFEEEPSETVERAVGEDTGAKIEGHALEASFILLEGDLDENEFVLGENTSVGRSPSNDICLKETKVSRQHAAINFRDGYYVLVDLKSSNGVFVNGKRIDEITLKDGDEVEIGSFKFQFNLT
jgi:hypothetical protein